MAQQFTVSKGQLEKLTPLVLLIGLSWAGATAQNSASAAASVDGERAIRAAQQISL